MENGYSVQALLDRYAIIDVMNRRATSADRRQWADYGACYTESFQYKSPYTDGWVTYGRDEMIDRISLMFAQYDATQHISANHVIILSGDEATCTSTLNATHYLAGAVGGSAHRVVGYYDTHLVRADGWRIDKIELVVAWEDGNKAILAQAQVK